MRQQLEWQPLSEKRAGQIAGGYIPPGGKGTAPELMSHETACVLNAGDRDAPVQKVCSPPNPAQRDWPKQT